MTTERPAKQKVVVESIPSELQKPREWLVEQLQARNYSQDDIFAVRLALEEAFYNAVKHGNRMNPRKPVEMSFSVDCEKTEIIMTDSGYGFNPNAVPDCRLAENLYKTEGRGLLLIRSYMDTVEYNERGNSIRMVRNRHQSKETCDSSKSA
ncbi:MAG: ATP-binding protein [Phycisphaerae bacterium]